MGDSREVEPDEESGVLSGDNYDAAAGAVCSNCRGDG